MGGPRSACCYTTSWDLTPQVLVAPPNDRLVGIWQRPTESLFTA